jgi:alkaline phosphatase D
MHPIWSAIERRLLVKLGTAGLAALALPGAARAMVAQGFTHGVASGEPGPNSVLLWTRYAASSDTDLTVEVAESADFAKVVAGGTVRASAERDFCAKMVVDGLDPGRWYFYRFIAPDGGTSVFGRTRTLPEGATSAFTLALFSCANLPFGHFNAYAHAAARQDIDLVVHAGDYLYEYKIGQYPTLKEALPGRLIQPSHEIVALADYRLRYASYRADADLQRIHQLYPMIAQWDDHELTNDAWSGGAQNHQPDEGEWSVRAAVAERVWREWMPVADTRWRHYEVGDLATIFLPETRLTGRDKQFSVGNIVRDSGDPAAALRRFRETGYVDPERQLLGADQESWLTRGIASSVAAGKRWQVCAQQVIMGSTYSPPESAGWFGADAPDYVLERIKSAQLAAAAGLPFNFDAWDGYPAARARLLGAAQSAGANFVSLAGDSHNGWAFDLPHDGRPAGIEVAGQSVTSPGIEASAKAASAADRAAALRGSSPQLRWVDTERRGYATVALTPDAVTANWHFLETVGQKSLALAGSHRMTAQHGRNRYDA